MAVEFEVEFDDKQIREFLEYMGQELKGATYANLSKKITSVMSAAVFSDVIDHFKNESGPGGAWKAWSKSYLDAISGLWIYRTVRDPQGGARVVRMSTHNMKKPPPPPRKPGLKLQVSGKLRNNFLPKNVRSYQGSFQWYNNAQTKSGYPYAWGHNYGDGKLPQREFMWLSSQGLDKVGNAIWQGILDGK